MNTVGATEVSALGEASTVGVGIEVTDVFELTSVFAPFDLR